MAGRSIRLIAWNVNHRSRRPPVPPAMAACILSLRPDVVVLTEYVPGPTRSEFIAQLNAGGLSDVAVSAEDAGNGFNHVLIASRAPLSRGQLSPPDDIDPHVATNALHVQERGAGLEVLGVRIPDFDARDLKQRTWDWLEAAADELGDRPAVILGDLNTDPSYCAMRCGDRFDRMVARGWAHALPHEGASYWTLNGEPKRIDHAFVSPRLTLERAEYVARVDGRTLVGGRDALSDHAALVVDVRS